MKNKSLLLRFATSTGAVTVAFLFQLCAASLSGEIQAQQSITFGGLATVAYGSGPVTLTATASSGLAVSFTSTTAAVCTLTGYGIVGILAPGTCSVTATQLGNSNYAEAAPVSQSFTVTQASQTITFSTPANVTFGSGPLTVVATASSGLPVSFASATSSVCTVSGSAVALVAVGTCSINATQAGNVSFSAATPMTVIFTVTPLEQAIMPGTAGIQTLTGNPTAGFAGDGLTSEYAALNSPAGVAVDGTGNLYIADQGNNRIRMLSKATGKITTAAGNGTAGFSGDGGVAASAVLNSPAAVAVDSAGNLYIADRGNNRIRLLSKATGKITTIAGNGTAGFSGDGGAAPSAALNSPAAVAVDSAGNLYIADQGNNRVRRVSSATGMITTVAGHGINSGFSGDGGAATGAGFYPVAVAVDGAGNLYIGDSHANRIRKVSAGTGVITTVVGNGSDGFSGDGGAASLARLSQPGGVAADSAGNLYIADQGNNRIRRVSAATGVITTVAGNGTNYLSVDGVAFTEGGFNPVAVALDVSGNLYIADQFNNRVQKVTSATGQIWTVVGSGNYLLNPPNLYSKTYYGTAQFSGDGGPAPLAGLSLPVGIAADSAGNLYVADRGHKRIRRISAATGVITTVAGNGTGGFSGDGGAATNAGLDP
ncbi:MAG: hypothetical protein EBY17_26620, partial [Acidobacteriia bacterium]|nr:hypothetical protein [Terriglobia bacterium]